MYCDVCGASMQWRSTNKRTGLAKYKCLDCGNVQVGEDENKAIVRVPREPKYYYLNNGRYIIHKVIDGRNLYYGCYYTEESAKEVVERLKSVGWDKSLLPSIKEEVCAV